MKQKTLSDELLSWLKQHYNEYENKELVRILTKKNEEERKCLIAKLEEALTACQDMMTRRKLEDEIINLHCFSPVTLGMIKKHAHRMGLKKSSAHISEANRKKAKKTNLIKWESKAVKVELVMPFFNNIQNQEVHFIKARDMSQLHYFSTCLSKWNSENSKTTGMILSANYDRENLLIRVESKYTML